MTPPPPEELLPLLEHPMATAAKAAASGATAFVLRFMIWRGGLYLILLLGPAGGSRHQKDEQVTEQLRWLKLRSACKVRTRCSAL